MNYDEMTAVDGVSVVRTPDAGANHPVAEGMYDGTNIGTTKSGLRRCNQTPDP